MNPRVAWMTGFLTCLAGLLFAHYLQYFKGLEPCPLCILQRIAMAFAGLGFLCAALHNSVSRLWNALYGFVTLSAASAGAAIAGRHVWLQSLPEDQVPACGPPLEHLMQVLPPFEVVKFVLRGEGSCAVIDASFLGLSLPGWTLVLFLILCSWAVYSAVNSLRNS